MALVPKNFTILLCRSAGCQLLAWLFLAVYSGYSLASPDSPDETVIYSFGIVPQFEQKKLFKIWRPLLDELENYTHLRFRLKGSSKIPEFEEAFLKGKYDFAYMNPYHFIKANEQVGYLPLIRDGSRKLKGIIVVKKDSPYQKVEDLENTVISLPSPNALGASLLTRADLSNLFHLHFKTRYVQTHSSVYLHVILGLTQAGGGVLSTLMLQPEEIRSQLRILYETRSVSPHPLAVHPRVPKDVRQAVQQALIAISQTAKGKVLFQKIPMNKVVPASLQDYQELNSWGLDTFWVN